MNKNTVIKCFYEYCEINETDIEFEECDDIYVAEARDCINYNDTHTIAVTTSLMIDGAGVTSVVELAVTQLNSSVKTNIEEYFTLLNDSSYVRFVYDEEEACIRTVLRIEYDAEGGEEAYFDEDTISNIINIPLEAMEKCSTGLECIFNGGSAKEALAYTFEEEESECEDIQIEELRYYYEHEYLPELFYKDDNFFDKLKDINNNTGYECMAKLCQHNNILMEYNLSDYKKEIIKLTDTYEGVKMNQPKSDDDACSSVFFIYNDAEKYYITLETVGDKCELCFQDIDKKRKKITEFNITECEEKEITTYIIDICERKLWTE